MTSGPSTEGPIMSVALDRALAPRARDWNAMWVFLLTTPSVECRFQFYVGLVGRDLFTILPIVQNFLLHAKSVECRRFVCVRGVITMRKSPMYP